MQSREEKEKLLNKEFDSKGKNQKGLLQQIDELKNRLDSLRPFDVNQIKNIEEYYETSYTYESNRIEGNSLSLQETDLVINHGLTIGGKPLNDHLEAINHRDAYGYVRSLAENKIQFNERELKVIHSLILRSINKENAGNYRKVPIMVKGSNYKFPEPYLIPKQMEDFFLWYDKNKDNVHPVLLAGEVHERIVTVHPFIDGNGRTSRLCMNLELFKHGYPLVNISGDEKKEYFECLNEAQKTKDKTKFLNFIIRKQKASLINYISFLEVRVIE